MNMALVDIASTHVARPGRTAETPEELRRGSASATGVEITEVHARELAGIVIAAFRAHGHICNVMTHISGARWDRVEEALCAILDPRAGQRGMTPIAENIIDLLCANRGVTGRIVKPCFEALLARILPIDVAARLCVHVATLFNEQANRAGIGKRDACHERASGCTQQAYF